MMHRFATGTLHIKFLRPTPINCPLTLRARVIDIKDDRIYTLRCDLYSNKTITVEAEVTAFLVYRSDGANEGNSAFVER